MERVQTGLRMPCDINERLAQVAQKRGLTKNALILEIINSWLEQRPPKESA